jgi:hypothetical protein
MGLLLWDFSTRYSVQLAEKLIPPAKRIRSSGFSVVS